MQAQTNTKLWGKSLAHWSFSTYNFSKRLKFMRSRKLKAFRNKFKITLTDTWRNCNKAPYLTSLRKLKCYSRASKLSAAISLESLSGPNASRNLLSLARLPTLLLLSLVPPRSNTVQIMSQLCSRNSSQHRITMWFRLFNWLSELDTKWSSVWTFCNRWLLIRSLTHSSLDWPSTKNQPRRRVKWLMVKSDQRGARRTRQIFLLETNLHRNSKMHSLQRPWQKIQRPPNVNRRHKIIVISAMFSSIGVIDEHGQGRQNQSITLLSLASLVTHFKLS